MTDSLDDQLEKLILKHEAFDGQASVILSDLVTDIKALIREREAELLDKVKAVLEVEIDDARRLEDGASQHMIMAWLLNARIKIAELERRHDG